jgi:nitrous oxidase accessory protein NosD
VYLKTKLANVRKDVVGARDEVITRVEEEAQSSKGVTSRLRFELSPMVTPLSRVSNSSFADNAAGPL